MTRLTGFSPIVRQRIKERANSHGYGRCEIEVACSGGYVEHLHHRRPRGAGGTRRPEANQPANGVGTCAACHSFVESNRQTSLQYGWLVPQHRMPAEVPMYRRHQWVMLSDSGDYQPIPEPAGGRVA